MSGLQVNDATSGFRAITRDAARRLNVFSKMTYTLETLIQAGSKGLRVESVPVSARPVARRSRLFSSPTKYVLIQGANILRVTALYKPLKIFMAAAAVLFSGRPRAARRRKLGFPDRRTPRRASPCRSRSGPC